MRHHALGVVALALVAACGGGNEAMTVTLTTGGCTYSGPQSVPAGPASIVVHNETGSPAVFDFHLINETNTYADLTGHVVEEQARLDAGTQTVGPPPFTTVTDMVLFTSFPEDRSAAEAAGFTVFLVGEDGGLDTTLAAGTYGVVCVEFADPSSPDATSMRVVGPYEATTP